MAIFLKLGSLRMEAMFWFSSSTIIYLSNHLPVGAAVHETTTIDAK